MDEVDSVIEVGESDSQSDVDSQNAEPLTLKDLETFAKEVNATRSESTQVVTIGEEQYQQYLTCQASIQVCLTVIIALLVITLGVHFSSILTRFWRNR